jgi:YbbR domain-containing protein
MIKIRPFKHFGLKLLSVGLAVLLWMAVSGEQTVERGVRVSLELQQFPPGLEIQGEPPSTVDVRVRGASGTLGRVSPGDIVAVLDLRAARAGRRLFHLTPEQVRVPFGVEVVQVTPPSVALLFEHSATRLVPVVPTVDGKPAPGYVVGKASADPATVEVIGPESSIEGVTEALTEPVSVAGARDRVRETVTLGLLDPALRLKTTRAAMVTVPVMPAPLERTVRDRPVHLRNLGSNLTAQAVPSVVAVGLRGSREVLNRVEPDDITAYVDLAGLGSGEYQLTGRADVSREVGITRVEPTSVQVRITSAKN